MLEKQRTNLAAPKHRCLSLTPRLMTNNLPSVSVCGVQELCDGTTTALSHPTLSSSGASPGPYLYR